MASRTRTYDNLDGRMAVNGAKICVSTHVGASLHPIPTFLLDILLALQAILSFLIIYHHGDPS
jgi:flagellar biosynthesis component FlhA